MWRFSTDRFQFHGAAVFAWAALVFTSAPVCASGPFVPPRWLEMGAAAVDHSPEFYWELEVKRLAREFSAPERIVVSVTEEKPGFVEDASSWQAKQAEAADITDFQKAVADGKLKPGNPDQALQQHKDARAAIAAANETTTDPLPAEFDSEFADYHKGAYAYRMGEKHWDEAKAAWQALLQRPAEQRHYRSVWAAFMLGKVSLYQDDDKAFDYFHLTRKLAADGFADTLGLAADSYGWEAKRQLDRGEIEQAAKLYLTQLALGDETAVVSLKACIPDRQPIDGMANFNLPEGIDIYDEKAMAAWRQTQVPAIEKAAQSSLLRRLTTAHVLATETCNDLWAYGSDTEQKQERCETWLAAIEKAKVEKVEDAAHLGWVAYTAGDYAAAGRWLKLDPGTGIAALWLKSKLLRRAGKLDEATQAMSQAVQLLKNEPMRFAWMDEGEEAYGPYENTGYTPKASAAGDLAALQLSRNEFVQAFEAFYAGQMHEDAAFVAEHVLTVDELKKYVDEHFKVTPEDEKRLAAEEDPRFVSRPPKGYDIRWLLGRRLVREDRYAEAKPYLPTQYRPVVDEYAAALKEAANTKLPKKQQAKAWFNAAIIARHDGMEIMGTEGEPDGFVTGGSFEPADVAGDRETGAFITNSWEEDKTKLIKKPLVLVPTAEEKKRLVKNQPSPNRRFHYRWIATALAWKSAQLLPDQSEELADVLNTAGKWIMNQDEKGADKFFQAIERRASKTAIGKAAGAKHWFVDMDGPWSETEGPKVKTE